MIISIWTRVLTGEFSNSQIANLALAVGLTGTCWKINSFLDFQMCHAMKATELRVSQASGFDMESIMREDHLIAELGGPWEPMKGKLLPSQNCPSP